MHGSLIDAVEIFKQTNENTKCASDPRGICNPIGGGNTNHVRKELAKQGSTWGTAKGLVWMRRDSYPVREQ